MTSHRRDGRGHWPLGTRRKPPTGVPVGRLLSVSVRQRGLRGTARLLGVDPHTVGRWLRGERFPDRDEIERIRSLVAQP